MSNIKKIVDKKIKLIESLLDSNKQNQFKSAVLDLCEILKDCNITKKNDSIHKKSGVNAKCVLSDELCDFLNLPRKSMFSRNETLKKINEYILKNNLQNPKNRRIVIPDAKLTKLLCYDENIHGVMFYYTITKLMQIHFTKN